MALKAKPKALEPQSEQKPEQKTDAGAISALPAPPPPAEEIASLQQTIAEMERTHAVALAREEQRSKRYQEDAEELRDQLKALMESPLACILSNGGNMPEIESRLSALIDKCANANTALKGSMTLKIGVKSGRSGERSVEFVITDKLTQPTEDEGVCILWLGRDGKLSESSAKQRDLLDVQPGPRRPNPTDEERLKAAREQGPE